MEVFLQIVGNGKDSEPPILSFPWLHKENKLEFPYEYLEY